MIEQDGYICYEASLKPCPRCGSAEQIVTGIYVEDRKKWFWTVECKYCPKSYDTEEEALKAWRRRYKENEIEQDGDITWTLESHINHCIDEFAKSISRVLGTDRPRTREDDDA